MKKILYIVLIFAGTIVLNANTLEECRNLARRHSPLLKQLSINQEISNLEVDNSWTNYYPQFSIESQAHYQSDVFSLPISIPGISIPSPENAQYQASLNINQLIWDGGATKNQVDIQKALLEMNNAGLEMKLYKLNEIVNTLYFNVLIIDKNIEYLGKAVYTLTSNLKQINSLVENGVLLPSNRKSIEIEILKIRSQISSLKIDRKTAVSQLEYYVGVNLEADKFSMPQTEEIGRLQIERPEINYFDAMIKLNNEYEDMANVAIMPKIALFAKIGYGKPNQFNMFEQDWDSYYIAGIKLQWSPYDWFKSTRNANISKLKNKNIEQEKVDFTRNIEIASLRDRNEIQKNEVLIRENSEISLGQQQIADEKFSQLQNGVITATEYLIEYNRYIQADISTNIYKIKLELSKINLLNKYGK